MNILTPVALILALSLSALYVWGDEITRAVVGFAGVMCLIAGACLEYIKLLTNGD